MNAFKGRDNTVEVPYLRFVMLIKAREVGKIWFQFKISLCSLSSSKITPSLMPCNRTLRQALSAMRIALVTSSNINHLPHLPEIKRNQFIKVDAA